MKKTAAQDRLVGRMFRAFSDRTRLRILHLLLDGEMCVGDLVSVLRVGQPSVSRHLAYLRKAGLVVVRKTKMWSYNSLAPAMTPFHAKLLECLACCFEEVTEIQKDRVRARKVWERGGCCDDSTIAKPDEAEAVSGCRSDP
jgi:ArsR family transcriptional regulator